MKLFGFDEEFCATYMTFLQKEWTNLRDNTPLTLTEKDVESLKALNDPIHLKEVTTTYLTLSRLLSEHVKNWHQLLNQRELFLQRKLKKIPFIIAIAGSVGVGKSTTARLLQALLKRWPDNPQVDLVTTDGFLYPNKKLTELGKMRRKGFPDSYDLSSMLVFLAKVKLGERNVKAPRYSHFFYDVLENEYQVIDQPDILIFEGLNVLQVHNHYKKKPAVFVSDFFDFSIYIDANEEDIRHWYLDRFQKLRLTAFQDKDSFFHKYALMSEKEALEIAKDLWLNINLKNLHENIHPTKLRADLILHKNFQHSVDYVALRRI